MAKKEVKTDLWVYELLQEANIHLTPQGCDIKEIDEALRTASKSKTGNAGYPEYCGVVKDFILVIEDKASLDKHLYKDEKGLIAQDVKAVRNYAVNGALFYARHLAVKTSYNKVLAIGVSGNEKHHRITPVFVDERDDYQELSDVETFISFNEGNIDEFYLKEILHEKTDIEKTTAEILKDAAELHEYLRTYGQLTTEQKPLVVSGIMLALREIDYKTFSIDSLIGDTVVTDGQKIYDAIKSNLQRVNVTPDTKREKLLSQFSVIKDTPKINEIEEKLGKTPLKHYTEFLNKSIFQNIKYHHSAEDYLGRFYGEFMSYSGGDGQTLGIVLTPKHITELFCELAQLKPTDKVIDPCCGTAGFLIAAMHKMVKMTDDENHLCKFINFEDDGFVVSKHIGLEETVSAKDKRQHLLDVWFGRIDAETKFCVETTIEAEDEWLHAFYYFNDEIPSEKDFENTMADYLTFEFNMITHGRGYLFDDFRQTKEGAQ